MNTATFDTHQAVKTITKSGLNDTQAEAIVTTIINAMNQSLSTKSDILAVRVDMEALKTELKTDMGELKAELKADVAAVRGELLVLKWMVGLIIAVEALPFLKFLFT